MTSSDEYIAELIKILPISEIQRATWIKSKNSKSIPLLLIFNKQEIPAYISIPGESALTKVYQYKNKPLLCQRCMNYGHSYKRCELPVVCANCDNSGHSADVCQSDSPKCHHCASRHATSSKECDAYIREMEIVTKQQEKGCSRNQAIQSIKKTNPTFGQISFREAIMRQPH